MNANVFARPSALVPLVMSAAALGIVLGHIAFVGTAHQADEGAAAHLFQLLIAGQWPIVAFFALRWLRRTPRPAFAVLTLQALAALLACAPVWYFNL